MKHTEISVIIPVYNTGMILQETIDSVLNQTFTDFELIIIDDGSTDPETLNILKAQSDRRIRLIRQQNSGVAYARNRGIAEAQGNYIAFLDHDDLFLPEKLMTAQKIMEKNPEYITVYSGIIPCGDPDENILHLPETEVPDFAALLKHNLIYSMSCVMIRREFSENFRIAVDPECAPCDDWDFHLQCALHGKICRMPHSMTRYRFHAGNQSKDQIKMYLAGIRTIHKYRKILKNISQKAGIPHQTAQRAVNFALFEHHYGIAFQYFFGKKDFKSAFFHAGKAFCFRPFSPKVICFIWKKVKNGFAKLIGF